LAVYVALLAGLLVAAAVVPDFGRFGSFLGAMGVSAGLVCLLGCYDDLCDMRAEWKLAGQIAATLPLVLGGFWVDRLVLFGHTTHLGWLGIPWTVSWLVLGINAMNLIDGLDGLASTLGIIVSVAIAWTAVVQGVMVAALPALVLAGALAGFLVYNLPPARIYLGDCGSMLTGLVLFALAMLVSRDTVGSMHLGAAVLLFFIPLLDTGLAVVRRTLSGRHFMTADRAHIHHRLADSGFRTWGTLALLAALCLSTAAVAGWLIRVQLEWTSWLVMALTGLILVRGQLAGHEEWAMARRWIARRLALLPLPAGAGGTRASRQAVVDGPSTRQTLEESAAPLPVPMVPTSDAAGTAAQPDGSTAAEPLKKAA